MTSKYLGKIYEGFKVESMTLVNRNYKSYKGHKARPHRSYSFTLYNEKENIRIHLTGCTLAKIDKKRKTLSEVLNGKPSTNHDIALYQQLKQVCKSI